MLAERIVSSSRSMTALVRDLLAYSRAGNSKPSHERVALDEVVARAIENLAAPIAEADAQGRRRAAARGDGRQGDARAGLPEPDRQRREVLRRRPADGHRPRRARGRAPRARLRRGLAGSGSRRRRPSGSSGRSTACTATTATRAAASGWRSAAASSRRTAGASGPSRAPRAARPSGSRCRLRPAEARAPRVLDDRGDDLVPRAARAGRGPSPRPSRASRPGSRAPSRGRPRGARGGRRCRGSRPSAR